MVSCSSSVSRWSVAKYMVKRCGPPSQGWRTFLRNHAPDIVAMDPFVVPTIGFDLLYGLVIVRLARRDLVWIDVTSHPTAEWVARQITEAFPWNEAPRYSIAPSSTGVASHLCLSSADFITIIAKFNFRYRQVCGKTSGMPQGVLRIVPLGPLQPK